MKKTVKALTLALILGTVFAFAGCGGEKVPEGRVKIEFWYEADLNTNSTYYELVKTYNDTQGVEDGVYVSPDMINGIGDERSTYEGSCDASVVMITNDEVFKGLAVDGLFVDMSGYLEESDFDLSEIPQSTIDSGRLTVGGKGEKSYAGEGQALLAMPFGTSSCVLFYNKSHFASVGINVISVSEEELEAYNSANGTQYQPHGYAEYLNAPAEGLISSQNMAGQTVYKVFNNRIPTNWEEMRYLSKMLTQSYNESASSKYGYLGEYWFQYGWSVGGDCIGYDGEQYQFTLMDKSANYLVTKPVTVNGNEYAAGEIVSYEDKVNQSGIESMDGLYELPSQYDAVLEFLRLSVGNFEVDTGITGYGVTPSVLTGIQGQFLSGDVAMVLSTYAFDINNFKRSMNGGFDLAPLTQYREYKGGSIYQTGTGFAEEQLKVIGETYGGEVYTGELAYENGTPLVGSRDVMGRMFYLVIPTNSDPAKYEAAWKFISWAAGEEGQKIMIKTGRFEPNQTSLAYNEFAEQGTDLNYWAVADASRYLDYGDWAYFESGEWVTDWANDFNNYLRKGQMTISKFLDNNETAASAACAETNIVILGRR